MTKTRANRKKLVYFKLVLLAFLIGTFFIFQYAYNGKYSAVNLGPGDHFSWYSHGSGMGGRVPKVTVDQKNPNIVYLGTDVSGIFKSTTGGDSWFPINNGIQNPDSGGVLVDLENDNVLYADSDGGLYKSTDAGANWVLKTADIKTVKWKGTSGAGTISLDQSKSNPDILYAISWADDFYSGQDGWQYDIYKTTDRGENWTKANGSNPTILQNESDPYKGNVFYAIKIDPEDANRVYLGSDKGIYFTADGGITWAKQTNFDQQIDLSLGYDNGHQLNSFSVIEKICQLDTTPVASPGSSPFVCRDGESSADCLSRCVNDYNPADDQFYSRTQARPRQVRSIAINPYNSAQIFALTAWGHVFKSDDKGTTWQEISHRDNNLADAGHLDPNKYFAWNDRDWQGFDSNNYSSTYARNTIFSTIKVDPNPAATNISLCKSDLSKCDYYLYVSAESGETRSRNIWRINSQNIKIEPNNQPSTACIQYDNSVCSAYAAVSGDAEMWEVVFNFAKQGGDFTRDSSWPLGNAWDGFDKADMFDLDLSSSYPNRTIYATGGWGATKGVASQKYKALATSSDDLVAYSYNYDWSPKWQGLENYCVQDILYDPTDPKYVYAVAEDQGFMRSTDGGKTFEHSMSGVTISSPYWSFSDKATYFGGHGWSLAAAKNSGQTILYMTLARWGYDGAAVFKSIDHGATWTNNSGTLGAANALPPMISGSASSSTIQVDSSDPNKLYLSMTMFVASHEDCQKKFELCKNDDSCKNKYSNSQLDNWQNTLCENPNNLSIWSTALTQNDINSGVTLDTTGRRPANINIVAPIWTSSDAGQAWAPISTNGLPESSWGNFTYDKQSNVYYFSTFDFSCAPGNSSCGGYGIYVSTDDGQNWVKKNISFQHTDPRTGNISPVTGVQRILDLKINPFDHTDIIALALTWEGTKNIPNISLIRSKDDGVTWSEIKYYQNTAIGRINFDPYRQGRIAINLANYYGNDTYGFLLSSDNGLTWTEDKKNTPARASVATAFHPLNPDKIAVAFSGSGLAWTYDPEAVPPAPTLDSARTYYFKSTSPLLSGTVGPNIKSLSINGTDESAALDDKSWSVTYNLQLGKNTLALLAEDEDGKTSDPFIANIYHYKMGDSNNDSKVDLKDFAYLMSNWNKGAAGQLADYNEDGQVDLKDFAILMSNWSR